MMRFGDVKSDILDATRSAGRQLVQSMKISPETMARITQPVVDARTFAILGNMFWKTCIAEKVTPKEFGKKKMIPRPDSLESFMVMLSMGLSAKAADHGEVSLQFTFSDRAGSSCHFVIENGKVTAREGKADQPDIIIETPFDMWLDIMTGKADGQKLFMEQQYKVTGDLALMLQLFKKPD